MEIGVDSYLHKKFKKQLSTVVETSPSVRNDVIVTPPKNHVLEPGEEKRATTTTGGGAVVAPSARDNNLTKEIVPNQSTNNQIICPNKNSFHKSSISAACFTTLTTTTTTVTRAAAANVQSPSNNACISYVVSNNEFNKSSFDTNHLPVISTTATTTTSSNFECQNRTIHQQKPEDPPASSTGEEYDRKMGVLIDGAPDSKQPAGKYVCSYCSLVCSKPSVLQKHIRAHTNERPFPCNSCGFSFKTRSNLYKHCRSRTHANRVMGNRAQEVSQDGPPDGLMVNISSEPRSPQPPVDYEEPKTKPYKPRFHTNKQFTPKENIEMVENSGDSNNKHDSDLLSHHINEIINKNNSIVNCGEAFLLKTGNPLSGLPVKTKKDVIYENNNEHPVLQIAPQNHPRRNVEIAYPPAADEPLNLTNKNRKRCMSEVVEPVVQKSLIKELLLKNLNSDMQCPHCKMIFQTVTELELHKLRSCKGFVRPGAKYSRSSSVNVASILTQNKNAFDNIPYLQNTTFPLKSPGPFLGSTRLVECDKNKSFSFDDGLPTVFPMSNDRLSMGSLKSEKKTPIRLFGGEVKIANEIGETKSFKIDGQEVDKFDKYHMDMEYGGKISENRVVKSSLQSGGTVLTNKPNYPKSDALGGCQDVIKVITVSPSIDVSRFTFDTESPNGQGPILEPLTLTSPSYKYTNIMDFSQKAAKLLTPNLKQPNLAVPGVPAPSKFTFSANPMTLYVNGKAVRHVPGIPGPVAAEEPMDMVFSRTKKPLPLSPLTKTAPLCESPKTPKVTEILEVKTEFTTSPGKSAADHKSPNNNNNNNIKIAESKKFARPNSLALKPTTASLKQHHGLTPTMFNQILISPDTPRVAKKYVQQFLHGNYFSYLGLKCSTKPVYCTLNKTQPFYVHHFKKLSMYSEWRQQDTKADKLYVSAYDSRQKHLRYTTAGKATADLVVHSSYKFVVSEASSTGEKSGDPQKSSAILGGYECNEDYTYIRGRGRGRYVCDQCGIRCKKPSMLKKHIRTHSDDRPYTCSHCNFSFKTKGNLTKHMKSKAHTKNYAANSSGSSTQQSGTQSSDSDSEDSGMDSSDESTRREEHEAAYGLLSLSQKTSPNVSGAYLSGEPVSLSPGGVPMDTDEIAQVSKTNYVRNKILDQDERPIVPPRNFPPDDEGPPEDQEEVQNISQYLGRTTTNRPLTYPYTTVLPLDEAPPQITAAADISTCSSSSSSTDSDKSEPKSIKQFHVIQRYAPQMISPPVKVKRPSDCSNSPPDTCASSSNNNSKSEERTTSGNNNSRVVIIENSHEEAVMKKLQPPVLKVNDAIIDSNSKELIRKRKISVYENSYHEKNAVKQSKNNDEVMDLSMPTEKPVMQEPKDYSKMHHHHHHQINPLVFKKNEYNNKVPHNGLIGQFQQASDVNVNYVIQEQPPPPVIVNEAPKTYQDYDNSAMETLADIATKQVKLEKNTLAKSVASEFLKIATKNEYPGGEGCRDQGLEVSELIVKPEGSKSCHICAKSFSKASQLRLHMNIHYIERPFRCHSCSVSFRTKGHLQKHERSASHHNKLSSSPALSSSEPRPFKCVDCNIAFRIHGHLAKHLRSKMHIMKLECLAKIPFGLYAELERSNSLLTEINTADGDQCLESLKTLAKKVFINEPNKLNHLNPVESYDPDNR